METKKTVLVVEDNRDSRELVAKVLKARGYGVVEAVDGEEALRLVEQVRPGLILMDISLPRMDGHEVTRRLKSSEELKAIPVIALTAHAMKGDREKALAAGCDGYITKPINIRELPGQIEQFLGEPDRK
ncbi:MAG: response regulator [Desulfobacterales bacterium]|nr:response regulator [Desulfobacterales bacterium]